MMAIFKKFQGLILALLLAVCGYIAYTYFVPAKEPVLSAAAPSSGVAVDQDLISLLLELKAIRLDESLFGDPAFRSLKDFSQELVPEPVGRTNPFEALGGRQNTVPPR